MKALSYLMLGLLMVLQPPVAAQTDLTKESNQVNLVVKVSGAHPGEGQIIASLFDAQQTHMKIPAAEQSAVVDSAGNAEIKFLLPGRGDYSVSVIHDLDLDGQLDTGLFGIPTEKIGFSNNARGRMGPAPWSKARFEVSENPTEIEILIGKAR